MHVGMMQPLSEPGSFSLILKAMAIHSPTAGLRENEPRPTEKP